MSRPIQKKFVSNNQVVTNAAAVTTTSPSPFQLTNPFPVGDLVYERISFRVTYACNETTGGGTVVTDGGLQFIRAIYFSTPQHAMIVEGLDGIALHDVLTIKGRVHPVHSDIAATTVGTTPTAEYALELPFKDPESYRKDDLGLDVLRSGTPLLQLNLGVYTDFVSGGAAGDSVRSMTLETHLDMDPGPIDSAADLPGDFMPYYGILKVPISSTVAQYQMFLAFGDRVIKRIYISQRNGSTLARLNNTVVGANDTDRISLKINSNFPWFDRIEWLALQDQNQRDYKLSSMITGMAVIDFVPFVLGGDGSAGGGAGAKLTNALSVLSKNQGTLELDADVTSVSNGQLWIIYEACKILPAGARRAAPQPKVG